MDLKDIQICLLLILFKYSSCTISEEKCSEYSQEFLHDKIQISRYSGADIDRQVSTSIGEFPHIVILGTEFVPNSIFWGVCGGSLISEQFVLSSAVCTGARDSSRRQSFRLHACIGVRDRMNLSDPNVQQFNITKLYIYPNSVTEKIPESELIYKEYPYVDVALLKLDRPVKFTRYARPACLYNRFHIPKSIEISIAGYGQTALPNSKNTKHSTNLRKVYVDLFTQEECTKEIQLKPYGILDNLMVCVGGRRVVRTTSYGANGSPLNIYILNDNIYEIVGIISFSKSNFSTLGPSVVSTRVAAYIPWIESIVWPCIENNYTPKELDEYILYNNAPPKDIPCPQIF